MFVYLRIFIWEFLHKYDYCNLFVRWLNWVFNELLKRALHLAFYSGNYISATLILIYILISFINYFFVEYIGLLYSWTFSSVFINFLYKCVFFISQIHFNIFMVAINLFNKFSYPLSDHTLAHIISLGIIQRIYLLYEV